MQDKRPNDADPVQYGEDMVNKKDREYAFAGQLQSWNCASNHGHGRCMNPGTDGLVEHHVTSIADWPPRNIWVA